MDFLDRCFNSLLKTNYGNFEVIFVDNASTDTSVSFISDKFRDNRIKIIRNDKNYGVAGARNIGFNNSSGDFIVFLDNDTEVDSNWLSAFVKVFAQDNSIAVAQSKLLNMAIRNKFDHAGDYLTPFGFLFERSSQKEDTGQFKEVENIFNAKGAATIIKSSIFKELGMYDDSYFMYLEETDFCFRVWLAGYRVVFVPNSIVWHAFNTIYKDAKKHYSDHNARYRGARNYITTLLKNLSVPSLIVILPFHIFGWLALSFLFIPRLKFRDSWWILKGIIANIIYLPLTAKKRFFVQHKVRRIMDRDFLKLVQKYKLVQVEEIWNLYLRKAKCYIKGVAFDEIPS